MLTYMNISFLLKDDLFVLLGFEADLVWLHVSW